MSCQQFATCKCGQKVPFVEHNDDFTVNKSGAIIMNKCVHEPPEETMDEASREGNVACLDEWKSSGLDLKWSIDAIDYASFNGHIAVLDWWKSSELECKWSERAMDWASLNGHIAVLDWWIKSGLECKWSENAMDSASWNGHIEVLDWWFNSGLKNKWSSRALKLTSQTGHVQVLDWWLKSGLKLKLSNDAMDLFFYAMDGTGHRRTVALRYLIGGTIVVSIVSGRKGQWTGHQDTVTLQC
jgi:hypothetical protein